MSEATIEARTGTRRLPSALAAAAVHLLTASGALWGVLALLAIAGDRFRDAFAWLALALVVDGVDGPLARRWRVDAALPQIDGPLLDNLIDFLNYVVVPAVLIHRAALLPAGWSLPGVAAIVVCAALQFSHRQAKAADHSFRGFPSCWNLVAFYLLLLRPAPPLALGFVLALCALSLAPIRFAHPVRTARWRRVTLLLAAAWAVVLLVLLARFPAPPRALVGASLAYPLYYAALSVLLRSRGRRGPD